MVDGKRIAMPDIAIMIEGQNGLTWPRWQQLVTTVESLGFAGLYRSDHFTNAVSPEKDSLELWVSLTWLADHTRRIQFGPLVTPMSFRHPALTARMASALDDLSGGRLTLGLGAGWQEREHATFGFDLLDFPGRFSRLEEGLQVIRLLMHSEQPVSFSGKYFTLRDAILLPRPARQGGPPVLIGGTGRKRTLPLAARYADEWNAVQIPAGEFRSLNQKLDELLIAGGRQPQDVRRSMMTGCVIGSDLKEVQRKVLERTGGKRSVEDLRQRGLVVGAAADGIDQLKALGAAGANQVMLQWLDLDDIEGLEYLSEQVLPYVQE